jgi:hypothetical protein
MTTNMSFEAWINPTGPGNGASGGGGIIVNREGEYEIARYADGSLRYAIAITTAQGNWVWVDTGFNLPLGEWAHIAFTYDGNMIRFYANGSLVHTNARTGGTAAIGDVVANDEFRIGGRQGAAQHFAGRMDEIRLWQSARSVEIRTTTDDGSLATIRIGLVSPLRRRLRDFSVRRRPNGWSPLAEGDLGRLRAVIRDPVVETCLGGVATTRATLRGPLIRGSHHPDFLEYGLSLSSANHTCTTIGGGLGTVEMSSTITNLHPDELLLRLVANTFGTTTGTRRLPRWCWAAAGPFHQDHVRRCVLSKHIVDAMATPTWRACSRFGNLQEHFDHRGWRRAQRLHCKPRAARTGCGPQTCPGRERLVADQRAPTPQRMFILRASSALPPPLLNVLTPRVKRPAYRQAGRHGNTALGAGGGDQRFGFRPGHRGGPIRQCLSHRAVHPHQRVWREHHHFQQQHPGCFRGED